MKTQEVLKTRLEITGMPKAELARRAGVTVPTINAILDGDDYRTSTWKKIEPHLYPDGKPDKA